MTKQASQNVEQSFLITELRTKLNHPRISVSQISFFQIKMSIVFLSFLININMNNDEMKGPFFVNKEFRIKMVNKV